MTEDEKKPSKLASCFMNISFVILAVVVAFIAAKLLLPYVIAETTLPDIQETLCTHSITRSLMFKPDTKCQSRSTL